MGRECRTDAGEEECNGVLLGNAEGKISAYARDQRQCLSFYEHSV
jgi:hypothetical protein